MKGYLGFVAFAVSTLSAWAGNVFVEAESFQDRGGWVIDQQFMNVMGSPFLLAHGMGKPVADAVTEVEVSEAGTYRVLARTRNWAAHWSPNADAPGKFQVSVNGTRLPNVLGTKGKEWAWHEAGSVPLPAGKVTVRLHDLTGFDGRCDALLLTSDPTFAPPSEVAALEKYRRQLGALTENRQPVSSDLIVVGGGVA